MIMITFGLVSCAIDLIYSSLLILLLKDFRYTCEQNEGMQGYGWEEYDIRTGGRQVIHDSGNEIDLTTEFVKIPGGDHGGSWAARISGKPREGAAEDIKTSIMFYAAMGGMNAGDLDSEGVGMRIENENSETGYDGPINIAGVTKELGTFRLAVTQGPSTNQYPVINHPEYKKKPLDRTIAQSGMIPEEHMWQAKAIAFQTIQHEVKALLEKYGENGMPPAPLAMTIPNGKVGHGNFHLVQKVFEGAFEFDIIYSSVSGGREYNSGDVTELLATASQGFKDKYSSIFAAQAPFDGGKYDQFSKSMFSNLLGGIGYFYGDSVIDRSYADDYEEENEGFWEDAVEARGKTIPQKEGPHELFSAVPSRPFFPRGFLWDEGFHLLPIADWDVDVTYVRLDDYQSA
jgi:mannosyl-oligosaccharide glucosidase